MGNLTIGILPSTDGDIHCRSGKNSKSNFELDFMDLLVLPNG